MLRDIRTDLLSATTSGRVPSQWPLAPSVASVTSVANDESDNEMIPGSVHRSPGICLTAEENPVGRVIFLCLILY